MIINLRDYKRSDSFFEYDFDTGSFAPLDKKPKETVGFCSFKICNSFLGKKMFVAIFVHCRSVFVVLDSKRYEVSESGKISFLIKKNLGISIFKRFIVAKEGINVNEVNYIKLSSSTEKWPDDYNDIFQFIVNTLSGKWCFDLFIKELVE